jgi:DNA-binding IclR family transcriptional regulator
VTVEDALVKARREERRYPERMSAPSAKPSSGAQTLARGLLALRTITASDGLTIQEVAEALDVHRTIAHRVTATLAEARLIARGSDGRFRGATGLLDLRAAAYESLSHAARPRLAQLADELGATASLLVPEQDEAVALLVVSPRRTLYRLAFDEGSRHPLDRAAGGLALRSARPESPQDPDALREARDRGYAVTFGEVEPGAWGIAAPVRLPALDLTACVNVITHREDLAEAAPDPTVLCARDLEVLLEAASV